MAYCRMSQYCGVYMYAHILGGYQFHLSGGRSFRIMTAEAALRRMKRLKAQGKFGNLDGAIERLEREIQEKEVENDQG